MGLLLEDGVVEEGALKSILHALLVSGGGSDKEPTGGKERGADGVERLSLKGCKKIREKGWNLVAEYLKMVRPPTLLQSASLSRMYRLPGCFLRFSLAMTGKELEAP